MTVGTLVTIVISVIAGLTLLRIFLTFYDPKKGRMPGREAQDLSRFLTVRHDQAIVLDDEGLKFPADSPLIMTFDQLACLAVITTDQGPWVDDAFLALDFTDGQAWLLPSEHPHYERVYEALAARLPLDYERYIAAMASTDNNEFIIWTRPLD